MKDDGNFIGNQPKFYNLDKSISWCINNKEDYEIAKIMSENSEKFFDKQNT